MEILIIAKTMPSGELIERLADQADWAESGVQLSLRKFEENFRILDPTIVVALVTATGVAFGAFATALLGLAREAKARKIILHDRDSRTIEYPADLPPESVQQLVDTLHRMEVSRIEID